MRNLTLTECDTLDIIVTAKKRVFEPPNYIFFDMRVWTRLASDKSVNAERCPFGFQQII